MENEKTNARGFTLIASLLMLLLLSGIAIGLLMSVNTEQRAGGNDLQNTMAYRSAEGGIEKMTADLANLFAQFQSPSVSQIQALSALVPTGDPTTSYVVYTLTPATKQDANGNTVPNYGFNSIRTGPNQGLYAQTLPVTLSVTANRLLGQEVSMTRQSEMALIPVFQFGIFSDSDLAFFAGPNLQFQGRVHTNGDLYLLSGDGNSVTFHDKVSAYGNIIRQQMPNGVSYTVNHNGAINLITQNKGCPTAPPLPDTNCQALGFTQGSVVAGPGSAYNNAWQGVAGAYNSWLINGNFNSPALPKVYNAGAKKLQLSLVTGAPNAKQFEIIRRPPNGGSAVDPSRLYTQAEIRILISDDPAELPGGKNDLDNIRLANVLNNGGTDYTKGVTTGVGANGDPWQTYFAEASTGLPDLSNYVSTLATIPPDWPSAPLTTNLNLVSTLATPPNAPLFGVQGAATPIPATIGLLTCTVALNQLSFACPAWGPVFYNPPPAAQLSTWNLVDGYVRVEVTVPGNPTPVAVTRNWLALGFARGAVPPTASGAVNPAAAGANQVNPKAILILQEPAERSGNGGAPDTAGVAPSCPKNAVTGKYSQATCTSGQPPEVLIDPNTLTWMFGDKIKAATSVTRNNWYPINFYDQREGEARDGAPAAGSCTANGVMNAVELDVGNLKNWLETDAVGLTVDKTSDNGYILYFSDRRGMQKSEWPVSGEVAGQKLGDSGLEDSINTGNAVGKPDQRLDTDFMPNEPGRYLPAPAPPPNSPPSPEDVNGNGQLDNVGALNLANGFFNAGVVVNTSAPRDPYTNRINSCITTGRKNWVSGARHVLRLVDGSLGNVPMPGFTVGSENPVYILGNYNTAASIDPIPDPTWGGGAEPVHSAAGVIADAVTMLSNNWSDLADMNNPLSAAGRPAVPTYYRTAICAGKNMNFPSAGLAWFAGGDQGTDGGLHNFLRMLENWGNQTLNYKGSMVSLYYSTYATGIDKGNPYSPPVRNYIFDPLFSSPAGLPPGTPVIRDVDNLSYRQDFTPRGGADK